jgi:hypothetical protein
MRVTEDAGSAVAARKVGPVPRGLRFTISDVWVTLAIAVPIIVMLTARMGMVDLAYHLRAGATLLDTHAIPAVDRYTFTAAGVPWLDQQWGAQAILALAFRAGSWQALALLRAAVAGLTALFVLLACRARGASGRAAALLTIAAFSMSVTNLAMRPQMLAYPLFAATLWIVVDRERHPARLWIVPPLAIVWANLHGSFVLAPAMMGGAWLGDVLEHRPTARRTFAIAIVTALATIVGPFGPRVWGYALEIGTSDQIHDAITEWAPTSAASVGGMLFFGSVVIVAGFLARRREPTPWIDLIWLAAAFAIGLQAVRGLVWWGLTAAVIVAGLLPARRSPPRADRTTSFNAAAIAGVVALVAILAIHDPGYDPLIGTSARIRQASQRHVEAVREALPAGSRLFVAQPSASWFEFALPSMPVFTDSRIEIFPDRVWTDYYAVTRGEDGWQTILDRWRVDAVVTDLYTQDLRDRMEDATGWRELYGDRAGAVFVRAVG